MIEPIEQDVGVFLGVCMNLILVLDLAIGDEDQFPIVPLLGEH
jgi:hypothetical protein